MYPDITCVFDGFANKGGIYISNISAAESSAMLKNLSIKAIVTALPFKVKTDPEAIAHHMYVPVNDVEDEDISVYFDKTFEFIDMARKQTNVLVHCYMGISRSATLVINYLLRKFQYSLDQTLAMIKRKRNKINPNKGFLQQLKKEAEKRCLTSGDKGDEMESILKKRTSKRDKKTRKYSLVELNANICHEKTPVEREKVEKVVEPELLKQKLTLIPKEESGNLKVINKINKIKSKIHAQNRNFKLSDYNSSKNFERKSTVLRIAQIKSIQKIQ